MKTPSSVGMCEHGKGVQSARFNSLQVELISM